MAKKIDLPRVLFIIMLLSFALGEIVRVQIPGGFAIKPLDLAVLAFVLGSTFFIRKKNKKNSLAKPILILFAVLAGSLAVNYFSLKMDEFLASSLYLVRWIMYAGVYFAVASFSKDLKKKVPRYLVYLGVTILSLGFLQYFFYPDLRNLYYLGWDEHLYRLFSVFLDPNFTGAFLVLFFLFTLGLFLKGNRKIYGVILILTLSAITLTFSRSAYVMFIAGLFTFLWIQGKRKLIIGFLLFFILAIPTFSFIGLRSEGTNLLRTTSTMARIDSAKNASEIFLEKPLLGVGFNAYEFASRRHGLVMESKYENHGASGTDNSFLFILATGGIVGFIAYLFMLFKIFLLSKKSAVLMSSFVALIVGSLFVNSLFYVFIMLWMWILLGLLED